jgi:hypothetical protein
MTTAAQIAIGVLRSCPHFFGSIGSVMYLLGLSGGITYHGWLPVSGTPERTALDSLGLLLIAISVWLALGKEPRRPKNPKRYGVRIFHPRDGDHVNCVDVRGEIRKPLPPGYALRLLVGYPDQDGFEPRGRVVADTDAGTWEALNVDVGDKGGHRYFIEICIVGPDGAALLDSRLAAQRDHRHTADALRRLTGLPRESLSPMRRRTADIASCAKVTVIRRQP